MNIYKLKLKNFRNHVGKEWDFNGNSVLLLGDNGTGKTNILEAIHLMATTKSLRADYDIEMISHNENFARIEAGMGTNSNDKLLEMIITKTPRSENTSTKKVKIDKVAKSLSNFAGTLNTVLFTPHDVELVTNSPAIRRKHLDALFFQIDKDYKKATADYKKALKQRNKVLEQIREFGMGRDQLDFWTQKVIENGNVIQSKRNQFFDFVNQEIKKFSKTLNLEKTDYNIKYLSSEISESRLAKYANAEIATAKTLVGPHRDDFLITINDFDVSKFGSRGQKRTAILAMKLCEIDFIESQLKRRPILLLDDIFSELDDTHKAAVMDIVGLQQTIITTADRNDIKNGLTVLEI